MLLCPWEKLPKNMQNESCLLYTSVQEKKVEMVNSGHNYIGDVVDSDLKKIVDEGRLTAYADFAHIHECDCVAILSLIHISYVML